MWSCVLCTKARPRLLCSHVILAMCHVISAVNAYVKLALYIESLSLSTVEIFLTVGATLMEFGRVSDDHYAGYVVDDSDLEYSDCSEGDRYA